MRDNIVAITMHDARSAGERVKNEGGDKRAVAIAAMRAAREGWLAPDENEAFAAATGALWELYPDDEAIRQETRAIGDRNKVLSALANGVPVDMDAVVLTEVPDDAIGLIEAWHESAT